MDDFWDELALLCRRSDYTLCLELVSSAPLGNRVTLLESNFEFYKEHFEYIDENGFLHSRFKDVMRIVRITDDPPEHITPAYLIKLQLERSNA